MGKKELNKKKILGVILSGGLSKRMGEDKAEKKIYGKSLIELTSLRSTNQVGKIIINSNNPINNSNNLNFYEIVKDCIPGNKGPLVGILTGIKWAIKHTKSSWIVTFPVDSPFFPDNMVLRFLEESDGYDVLIAKSLRRIHPVFSMWRVSSEIEEQLENSIRKDERKIDRVTKKFKTKVVNFKYIRYDPFFNVNTINDLEKAKIIYEKNFMGS